MRLWCARGIPCVMAGPSGIELAHAVDERVRIDELLAVARTIVRVAYGFGAAAGSSAGGG
jgi:acetylornithine deacetylase